MKTNFAAFLIACAACAQDPYTAAGEHYKLKLDNAWVQVALVAYGPHEKSPVHDHPAFPTVYVYTTDGGAVQFNHDTVGSVTRNPVKAGQIRFARPNREKHTVEYLGDQPMEYFRVELKTDPRELPPRDVRLPADPHSGSKSLLKTDFENDQVRIVRFYCASSTPCQPTEHPGTPAVTINLTDRTFQWIEPHATEPSWQPGDYIRIELKTPPIGG